MKFKADFFNPVIVALAMIVFLMMGYVGSFNYRFEDPLNFDVFILILIAVLSFLIPCFLISKKENPKDISFLNEKIMLALVIIALALQSLNLVLLGGIPLLNSTLKSSATTNIWRIAYPLFLIMMNLLLSKYYSRKYLLLVVFGALIFGLNGYRTSVLGILGSSFIVMYYLGKISKKVGLIFVLIIISGVMLVGYVASQSISSQHWTLNPLELVFYRSAFTLEVLEKIIPLAGTTHGHILSMIFSSGSPRTFIGEYVLHYNVCLTSTILGPVMLDFSYIGVVLQMILMGCILKALHVLKRGIGIGIYSMILTHTLIWIETGPTDIMIWFLYLIGVIYIITQKSERLG